MTRTTLGLSTALLAALLATAAPAQDEPPKAPVPPKPAAPSSGMSEQRKADLKKTLEKDKARRAKGADSASRRREAVRQEARRGLPPTEYAVRVLAEGRVADVMPRTGAELVAYWEREGVIGSRPDIVDPEAYARSLRRQAETRGPSKPGLLEGLMQIQIDAPPDFSARLNGDRDEAQRAG